VDRLSDSSASRAIPLTVAVCLLAAAAFIAVARGDPQLEFSAVRIALTLALVGLGAQLLSYNAARAAAGSIALIPFAGAALIAPHSISVVAVVAAELVVQLVHRRSSLKSVFNLAQSALGISAGILAFRSLGTAGFIAAAGLPFLDVARALLVPTTLLVGTMLMVNTLSVSGAIAVTTEQPLLAVWSRILRASTKASVLLVLLAFYLSWLNANLGIMGTLVLVLPMMAVRQLHRTAVELTTVTEELLDLMVAAIEARDQYTSGHSQRVARGSEIIARAMGIGADQVERVAVAALLHDVGKIDERFAPILAKEGRLTPEEWAIMKLHPIRGSELVGKLSSLRDIVAPVRHHHENWDGTGYPDGLRGELIPLASRIIMFADTLDAITTDRPYRKALGLDEARAEFLRFRGKQFDPLICDKVVSDEVWTELYGCFGAKPAPSIDAVAS
jgi:HD-GYP domain-containing protein (c-di-GMP phosphodiesterase class II)